jgi:Flp pilus assembly pilin Flp
MGRATPRETKVKSAFKWLRGFAGNERGLVTVEWVALAGAVVIGGITVVWIVMNNLQTPASSIGSNITSCETSAAQNSGSTTGCQ